MEPVVKKYALGDRSSKRDDRRYWMSQPPEARIAEVQRLRAEYHGWTEDNPEPRMQRVVTIIKLDQK